MSFVTVTSVTVSLCMTYDAFIIHHFLLFVITLPYFQMGIGLQPQNCRRRAQDAVCMSLPGAMQPREGAIALKVP